MITKYYIFNIEQHTEYDTVQNQRLIKVEDEKTIHGFDTDEEAENWISDFGLKGLEYVILKTIKI